MPEKKKQPTENYLKLPNHILNIRDIGLCEKVLLSHIYSFGKRGCYQSNKTLAEIYMTSPSTIRRWLKHIRKYLYVKCPKGYYRTFWAKSHPDVQAANKLWWRGKEVSKQDNGYTANIVKSEQQPAQKCATDMVKNNFRHAQKRATINNNTITETKKDTTATPTPLPAGGQASALLNDRKNGYIASIEQLKNSFGCDRRRRTPELTAAEREQRRQKLQRDLLATKAIEKG